MDPAETLRGCEAAKPGLDAFLDAELARWRLGGESVALVGFSQGTMMALHVGLARKPAPAAIVGFSGMLVGADRQRQSEGIPPVLLTHGDQDQVIPPQALFMSASSLGRAGLPVQWHLAQGIGHGIDGHGLTLAGRFLFDAFAGRLRPRAVPASCNYPR
jgi:phospholipase/carboxylesterase